MRSVLFLTFLAACEQVAPSGNPLKPVQVQAVSSDVEAVGVPAATPPEEEEVFTISSEELQAIAEGTDPAAPVEGTEDPPAEGAALADPPVAASAAGQEQSPPPQPKASQGWPKQVADAWPVRLVTTVPNASPPRAILGLPDGREVVVNPGSMVPDMGLVVVAISPNSAELAKILPAGDHATIESITLTAQY